MKWLAVGEIGGFLLGLLSAIGAVPFFDDLTTFSKVTAFVLVWYFATKAAQWFIHLGYDETMRPKGKA